MLHHSTHNLGCNATSSEGLPSTQGSWTSNPIAIRHLLLYCLFFVEELFVPLCVTTTQRQELPLSCSLLCSQHPAQIRSVAQSCPTLCDPMNRSTPGLPVHHQLPEFTQTHVHRVSDAIQPSHPLSSPSPPAPNPSQHQSLFQ